MPGSFLDEKNLEILRLLGKNYDVTNSEIAEEIDISHTSVGNRLKKMKTQEFLNLKPCIDYSEYNHITALQFIETNNQETRKKATEKLKKCPRTILVVHIFEEYDILSILISPNIDVIEKGDCGEIPIEESKIRHKNLVLGNLPIKPKYLDYIPKSGDKNIAPCGTNCEECEVYKNKCPGCPDTKFFDPQYYKEITN